MRPFTVGLTGGIGSGKSAAADLFGGLGATVVDTDLISHQLTGPDGAAMPAIRAHFGDGVVRDDGALDRAVMRQRVFADPAARAALEGVLHPMIRAESERQVLAAQAPYVILVVPLLIESGVYRERCDRICVVDVPESVQVERVVSRSSLTPDEVRAIIRAQTNRSTRRAAAHDIIDNSFDFDSLRSQVESLHARYLVLAAERVR
ncbi:dephospho-CoA kinase [Uliginosibacterium sp. sgz301328]|uniref:dephospho-CoA kinase n=1 Tax=Uliginosibacterium sp. sgz301328 TaxID=3243764 RepID=UPI00359DFA57